MLMMLKAALRRTLRRCEEWGCWTRKEGCLAVHMISSPVGGIII